MNLRSRGEKPYVICGILALVTFVIGIFIVGAMDPNWNFGPNALSEMGTSSTPGVREAFAITCALTGILGMAFGIGKMLFEKNWAFIGGMLTVCAGISIILVGAISADYLKIHNAVAAFVIAFLGGSIILATINEILDKSRFMLIFGIIIGILALSTSFLPLGYAEVGGILCGVIWFIVHFILYFVRKFECPTPENKVWCP